MIPVAGGASYLAYVPLSGENPLFVQVRSNWARVQAAWSIRAWLVRRDLGAVWSDLERRQAELRARAAAFDAAWPRMRIEDRAEAFNRTYRLWEERVAVWRNDADSYEQRCAGRGPSTFCVSEYKRLTAEWREIESRGESIRQS